MKIRIHDVDHGACALITGPQGHRLMIDCGRSLTRPWLPSVAYEGQHVDTLILQNLDEDHVEDLPALLETCSIGGLVSNTTISASALAAMKLRGMRPGVQKVHDILSAFGSGPMGGWSHSLGGVHWNAHQNRYFWDFTDTNNLSLAVFVSFGGFTILFGGDMETAGWRKLLRRSDFRTRLADVKVFVASHHGRENGRCAELFELCKPKLILFSDGPKQYATQETVPWYSSRASGIPDLSPQRAGRVPQLRRVMTTRRDGTIQIDVEPNGRFMAYYERGTGSDHDGLLSETSAFWAQTPLRATGGF